MMRCLDKLLNLSEIWDLSSLDFLICKMELVMSPLPADLLPTLKAMYAKHPALPGTLAGAGSMLTVIFNTMGFLGLGTLL